MALCSLSMGSRRAPLAAAADIRISPATTRASLLASSRRLPARAAARVGSRPAAPTMAAMTISTSGRAATWARASGPASTSGAPAMSASRPRRRSAAPTSARTARAGRWRRHCSARRSASWLAVRATTRYSSGWRPTTSRVLMPMEPVAPRTQIPFIAGLPARSDPARKRARRRSGYRCDPAGRHARAGVGQNPSPPGGA